VIDHYDDGALRSYLDEQLPQNQRTEIAAHLVGCDECKTRLDELTALTHAVSDHFSLQASTPNAQPSADTAFARLRPQLVATSTTLSKRRLSRSGAGVRTQRVTWIGAAAAVLLTLGLVLGLAPGAGAAAAQFLQIFRAQSVVYVSVSPTRVQQLQQLPVDPNTLFLAKPTRISPAPTQQAADSLTRASDLAGIAAQSPTSFPSAPESTTYMVEGQSAYQLQVNVKTLREALKTLGVTDVTIPDALGAQPITMQLPPVVRAQYAGKGYTITLTQGTSPTVMLPDGVNLSDLGRAALEVYGMSPSEAATLSRQIDWRSTLVFPFPAGMSTIQQVAVGDAQGVLFRATNNGARDYLIYWQRGSQFYVLDAAGSGLGVADALSAASSVR
jgi:anti-sigma factor RsiW